MAGAALLLLAMMAFPPDRPASRHSLAPPGGAHWLGTNDIGQDVLAGLLLGLPGTVLIPVAVAALSLLIAGGLAAIAALRGGWSEAVILRLVEVLQLLPSMFLLVLLASWIRPGFFGVMLLLAVTASHDDVRVLRAILLREIPRENVQYARLNGASWFYCLRCHVLPAVWPAVLAVWVQNVHGGVMRIAGLGFLGLIDPRIVTWGGMMQEALPWLYGDAWLWLLLPPAFTLSIFVTGLILVAKRLEERVLAAGVAQ